MLRSSQIFVTTIMEVKLFYETSVFTKTKKRNVAEAGFLNSPYRKNLKSYISKCILYECLQACSLVKYLGLHIVKTLGSKTTVKLSALSTGRAVLTRNIISYSGTYFF
jgi:hypothetical protein